MFQSVSQVFMVGKGPSSAKKPAGSVRRAVINPLHCHRTPSFSPLRDLPSLERALYRGMKLDASSDSTFSPPPPPAARLPLKGLFCGKRQSSVEDIDSSPPDVKMNLGGGKTTESDGLGDSRHASPAAEEVLLVGSTDYGSMPVLPSTLIGTWSMLVSPKTTLGLDGDSMDVVEQDAQVVSDIGDGSVAD